jgi:hypothetical protein
MKRASQESLVDTRSVKAVRAEAVQVFTGYFPTKIPNASTEHLIGSKPLLQAVTPITSRSMPNTTISNTRSRAPSAT